MKRLLLVLHTTLTLSVAMAQRPSMGGGLGPEPIKAEELAEILFLEPEKITKKIKLKGPEEKLFWKLTSDYNQEIDSIQIINFKTLEEANRDLLRAQANAMRNRDPRAMQSNLIEISRKIDPVLKASRQAREKLVSRVQMIVDRKQFQKFEKILSREVENLKPRMSQGRRPSGRTGQGSRF